MQATDAAIDRKGKGKAVELEPPSRKLLQKFYPLVLPLPLYLKALLPGDNARTAHSPGNGAHSNTSSYLRPWWLFAEDQADQDAFPALDQLNVAPAVREEARKETLWSLRNIVICITSHEEASRLRSLLKDSETDLDARSSSELDSSDRILGQEFENEQHDKGLWRDWEPPESTAFYPSEEGESIEELVRHAQQLIVKRNSVPSSATKSTNQNVLTLGYRPADVRSETLRISRMGHGPSTLTSFYVNTLVTSIILGIEWRVLLHSVGAKVFLHLLTTTSVFQAIPGTHDCFTQMSGRPVHELPELNSATQAGPSQIEDMEHRARGRKRKRRSPRDKPETSAFREEQPLKSATMLSRSTSRQLAPLPRTTSSISIAPDAQSVSGVTLLGGPGSRAAAVPILRKPSAISLVRSRMFYARPIKTRYGRVHVGLPFIHPIVRSSEPRILAKMTAYSPSQEGRLVKRSKAVVTKPSHPMKHAAQKQEERRVRHLLKYVFPRQFGLHNVFTSPVDRNMTTQALHDYTMREAEIKAKGRCRTPKRLLPVRGIIKTMLKRFDGLDVKKILDRCCPTRIPKGKLTKRDKEQMAADLSEVDPANIASRVEQTFQASQLYPSQSSLPITQLPRSQFLPPVSQVPTQALPESDKTTQGSKGEEMAPSQDVEVLKIKKATPTSTKSGKEKPRFYKYAISSTQVSHFVYVVLKTALPHGLLGSRHNLNVLVHKATKFVCARRYESLTLHEVLQGIRISEVDWIIPVNVRAQQQRPTAAESQLRHDLVAEMVYWIMDSLLMPLLRTTFYITESAAYRNRTLYFRQDDWARASAPLLNTLKTSLFEPITNREALQIMSGRNLGYSHIRLLPKELGVRPIINLRRRSVKQVSNAQHNTKHVAQMQPSGGVKRADPLDKYALNRSINNILQSTFHILTYERSAQPDLLGASVFGMNDVFQRLNSFRRAIASVAAGRKLYFVKVDVQAAFDTIEQGRLLDIVRRVLTGDDYVIQRFTEVMPAGGKVKKHYVRRACPESKDGTFAELAQELANSLRHVIFVDGVVYGHEERRRVLTLLEQHIQGNLIKIGREFFKQRIGIPQGSSLSTLLCSMFYADMERTDPNLLPIGSIQRHDDESLKTKSASGQSNAVSMLMRYTDDFLFISTSRKQAKAFFASMLKGHPEYGCFISPQKTLANFDLAFPDGGFVPIVRERKIKRKRARGLLNQTSQPATSSALTTVPKKENESVALRIGAQLPWCGILLNTVNLSVTSDLTRYHDTHIADTLTVETGRKPGATLVAKLLQSIQTRSQLILVDPGLNGEVGAHINIYHTCMLAALKLIVYARSIGANPITQCRWMTDVLRTAASFQYTTIAARIRSAVRARTKESPTKRSLMAAGSSLKQDTIKWLALHAFRQVLSTRPAQWHAVVKLLDKDIATLRPGHHRGVSVAPRKRSSGGGGGALISSLARRHQQEQDESTGGTSSTEDRHSSQQTRCFDILPNHAAKGDVDKWRRWARPGIVLDLYIQGQTTQDNKLSTSERAVALELWTKDDEDIDVVGDPGAGHGWRRCRAPLKDSVLT
ncbi:hypothetical protein OC846_003054 [Tilletia horrida]|uniref:Telomerase reverse transcriptase n=1 Tax=Tilletia horrida TaxID=155126 RepID=A0AAN6GSY0_9BASI|nr:hypothetical protein OC846_003054 [Tilletia horrida]